MIKTMTSREAFKLPDPKYIALNGDVATVYTGEHIPATEVEKPVIKLSAGVARIKLRKAGLLDIVQAAIDTMGPDIKDRWEYDPYINSDNPLVKSVLKSPSIGMTDEQIYHLFFDE